MSNELGQGASVTQLPRSVRVIGALWLLLGLSAVCAILFWSARTWDKKMVPLGFAAGVIVNAIDLWRRRSSAWRGMIFFALFPLLLAPPALVLAALDRSWLTGVSPWAVVLIGASLIAAGLLFVWQVRTLTKAEVAALYGVEVKAFWGRPAQWGIGLAVYVAAVMAATVLCWMSLR